MSATASQKPDQSSEKPELAKPKGVWGTVLTLTPVILTVLATAFAGMSSSEMTQSMFFRSLAAQQQSKAGDQWSFFQSKRIRGTNLEMTVELLQSLAHPQPFDAQQIDSASAQLLELLEKPAAAPMADTGTAAPSKDAAAAIAKLKKAREALSRFLADPGGQQCLTFLIGPAIPKSESQSLSNKKSQEEIDAVIEAIAQHQSEDVMANRVRTLKPAEIDEAVLIAEQNGDAFDNACKPTTDKIKQLRSIVGDINAAARPLQLAANQSGKNSAFSAIQPVLDGMNTSFKSATFDFDARRYRQESLYNQKTGELYEVRVRRSGLESDRHRERSKKFFYSMLVAQAGVTIASLALARAQRSVLWLLAAVAGLAAIAFSGYVYLSP